MNFRILLITMFLFAFLHSEGQVRFSETIQESKIASANDNALFFIDFWATWCGPCVYANEYLEVLQKQYPNKFYVVSLSEENPDKVRRHLKKRPTELAVAIDYEGLTFDEHKVKVLPYGILLNSKGKILWNGSPTDFKTSDLNKFLKENKSLSSIDEVFKIESPVDDVVVDYIPKNDFEIKELKNELVETLNVNFNNGFLELKGSLSDILTNNFQISKKQIVVPDNLNLNYHVFIKNNEALLPHLISALDIELSSSEMEGEVLVVDNSKESFWDTKQIDWGKDTARYLIDDNQIQADNVSFKDVLYQLSSVLELPIKTTNPITSNELHDWMIHYKFYSLMQNDLLDNYGLKVEKQQASFKSYIVTKKTP